MSHRVTALVAAGAALGMMLIAQPEAHAGLTCEHRSQAHSDQHGGLKADSAWHVAHGQLPTCDSGNNQEDSNQDQSDDSPAIPHRDHAGYHCKWLVMCG